MNCPIIPSKENQLAIYTLVASGLLENSKNTEQFNVNDYIKELYDYLSTINDSNEAAVYTSLIPKFIRKAYGLNDEVADLLVSQLKTTRDLEKSFDSDFENVINYIVGKPINIGQVNKIIAAQPPVNNLPPINTSTEDDYNVDDFFEAIPLDFFTTTGRQTEIVDGKFTNIPIKSKDRTYNVLKKILSRLTEEMDISQITNSSELNYYGQQGLKLRLINETELPSNITPLDKPANEKNLVYVITDNNGNFLSFDNNGLIDKDGQVIYYSFRAPTPKAIAKIDTLISEIMERRSKRSNATNESLVAELKILNEKKDAEIKLANDVQKEYKPGSIVLASIKGGSKGYIMKGEYTPLSKVNNAIIASDTISYIKAGDSNIRIEGIDGAIPIKGSVLSPKLEDNLSRVLASRKLTNEEKTDYLNTIVFVGKKIKLVDNVLDGALYLELPGSNKTFNLNTVTESEILQALSQKPIYFGISMSKLESPRFLDIQIDKNGKISKTEGNYYDLVKENAVIAAIPNAEGNIVQVNGYFNLEYIPQVVEKAEEKIADTKADTTIDIENPNPYNLESSKFLESTVTPEQEKRASKWMKEAAIFKVKVDGKHVVPIEVLRNIVNSDAFASWSKSGIKLFAGSNDTHGYHEAWHAFSQLFLSKEDKKSLYSDASKLPGTFKVVVRETDSNGKLVTNLKEIEFSKATPRQLEEYIAEEFRKYAIAKGDTKGLLGSIGRIFRKMWNWLKAMYTGITVRDAINEPSEIKPLNDMFKALYVGGKAFNKYQSSIDNIMFSSANFGIISLDDINEEIGYADSELIKKSIDGILSEALLKSGPKYLIRGLSSNANKATLYKTAVLPKLESKYKELVLQKEDTSKLNANEIAQLDHNINLLKWTLTNFEKDIDAAVDGFSEQSEQVPGVIAFHMANSEFKDLLKLNVEEEEVDGTDEKELEKTSRMGGREGNSESSMTMANKQVLYLVKSLLKQETDTKYELNDLGFPELVDFVTTWNVLTRKLTGTRQMSSLHKKMVEFSEDGDLLFRQLLRRLGSPIVTKPKTLDEVGIWFKFLQDFNKPIQELWSVIVEAKKVNDEIVYTHKIGRASSDFYKVIANWNSQFRTSDKNNNKYILQTPDGENYLDLPKIVSTFLKKEYKVINGKVEESFDVIGGKELSFLNSIGINMSMSDLNRKDIVLFPHNKTINFIANKIGELNNVNAQVINPIETLSNKQIITKKKVYDTTDKNKIKSLVPQLVLTDGKNFGANINRLAELESSNTDDYSSLARLTANGKRAYEQTLNSSESQVIYALQNVKNKNEFSIEDGEYDYMSYLDEANNPASKASWLLNSLFDGNGLRIAAVDIDIKNASGVTLLDKTGRTGEMVDDEGTSQAEMGTLDKFLSDFKALLTSGIMLHQQAGSKNTHLATKVSTITTYTSKKQNHLYIDSKEFITSEEGSHKGQTRTYDILVPYMQMELERMIKYETDKDKDGNSAYALYKGFSEKTTGQFTIFDDIFSDEVKDALKKASKTELQKGIFPLLEKIKLADILNDVKNAELKLKIQKELNYYFNNLYADYKTELADKYGFVNSQIRREIFDTIYKEPTDSELAKLNNPLYRQELDNAALRSFIVNSWINNIETSILHYRDTSIFNHGKDEFHKRTSLFQSTGKVFPTDIMSINLVNSLGTPYTKSITGKSRVYNGKINTAVIQDYTKIRQYYYDILDKLFTKDFLAKGIKGKELTKALYGQDPDTKVLGKKESPKPGGRMTPYFKTEVTDGQGYISLDSYRTLKNIEGKWSNAQEALYKKIVNKESPGIDEITEIFPVYKLQMAGNLKTARGLLPVTSGHKFALMPLIPDMIEGSPLEDLHKAMMDQEIDYITHDSGSKLASIGSSIKDGKVLSDKAFDDVTGKFTGIEFTKNIIYANYLKNQVDLHEEYSGVSILSSQLRKLISSGLIEEKLPIDFKPKLSQLKRKQAWHKLKTEKEKQEASPLYKLVKNFDNRVDKIIDLNTKKLISKIDGWSYDNATKSYRGPESSMISFIEREFKKQGLASHEIAFIKKDPKGNLARDLSGSPSSGQMQRMLMSIINNKIIKQMVSGEALVEVSVANTFKFKNVTKEMIKYGYTDLNYYEPSLDGTPTKASQCKIAMQGSFVNLFNLTDLDNELIKQFDTVVTEDENGKQITKKVFNPKKSLDNLNSLLRNEEWLNKDNNRKKIRLTGVRIPVQGLNSMEFLEIAEFLPADTGPIIILPQEIVAKSGTDFDVDKLTTYIPYISKSGKYFEDSYTNEKELDDEIVNIKQQLVDSINKEFGPQQTIDKVSIEKLIERFHKEKGDKYLIIKALKFKKDELQESQLELAADIKEFLNEANQNNALNGLLESMLHASDELIIAHVGRLKKIPKILSGGKMTLAINDILINIKELKSIKDTLKDSYDTEEEVSQNKEIRELNAKYKDLKDHKRNYIKSIQNSLINDIVSILELPQNAVRLLTANDTHLTKVYADEMEKEAYDDEQNFKKSRGSNGRTVPKGISPTRIFEYDFNLKKHQNNFVGKNSLGIAASNNPANILYNNAGAYLPLSLDYPVTIIEDGVVKEEMKQVPTEVYLNTRKSDFILKDGTVINAISLSHTLDSLNENEISEIISQLMNGFVDVEKDAWVAFIQGNKEVTPTIIFLLEMGIPFKDIVYYVNNPLIRKYISEVKSNKGVLGPLLGKNQKNAKSNARNFVWNSVLGKKGPIPNLIKIQEVLRQRMEGKTWGTTTLKDIATSKIDTLRNNQNAIDGFMHFIYIEDLVRIFLEPRTATNFDTKKSTDLFDVYKRQQVIDELYNSNKMPDDILDYFLKEGPIRGFKNTELVNDMFGFLYKFDNDPVLNSFIYEKLKDYSVRNKIKKVTGLVPDNFSSRFKNTLKLQIFVDNLKSFSIGESQVYKGMPVKYTNDLKISAKAETVDGVTTLYINENILKREFKNNKYTEAYNGPGSYKEQKLARLDPKFFYRNNNFREHSIGAQDYYEYVIEREYLRHIKPFSEVSTTVAYKTKYNGFINTFKKKSTETEEEFATRSHDVVSKTIYEQTLRELALENTFNINAMFYNNHGSNTTSYAKKLMGLVKKYEKTLTKKYSILTKLSLRTFKPDATQSEYLKDLMNIALKNHNDLTSESTKQYFDDLSALANPNIKKLLGDSQEEVEDNARLSDLFSKFSKYIFLQGGINKNEFAFTSILPYDDSMSSYTSILNEGVTKMTGKITNEYLENALNLFLQNNNQRTRKLNQRTSAFNLRAGKVSKEYLKGERRFTIIKESQEFKRVTPTAGEEIYTVNLNGVNDNNITELADLYKGKAYYISADTYTRKDILNTEGTNAADNYVSKMPITSKFLYSYNFGLGLRLSKDIGVNYKLTFDNLPLIKNMIDEDIQEMAYGMAQGVSLIFDENGYGQNLLEYPIDATPETIALHNELYKYLTDQLKEKLDYVNPQVPIAVTIESPTQPSTSVKPGVSELFESKPELASIGTPEQYSQYLDTKDTPIVYHGSPKYFEKFDKAKLGSYTGAASAKEGFFFGSSRDVSKSYLDKRGQTLDLDSYIKTKYGSNKKLAEKAIAVTGGFEVEIENHGWYSDSYAILHNGTVIRYDENGNLYFKEGETIDSPSFLETLEHEKNNKKDPNTLKSIRAKLNKSNAKDAELYKNYEIRKKHLRNTFDENYGGYIDKNRKITDEPFEDLFLRPFTLKLKNPLIVSDEGKTYREETYYERVKKAKEGGHDGLIITDTFDSKYQTKPENIYVVFDTDAIEESGSKQDIEGFKEFATQPSTSIKNFDKKNLFTVTPQPGVSDNKAKAKASIATQYIGFGEDIIGKDGKRSTTQIYREQAGKFANTGNYSSNDIVFVSVPGKRGDASVAKREQDKTIKEATKAIEAGATILTDNKAYTEDSNYNTGEQRLYKNMEAKGYNYSEITVDGQLIGTWSKSTQSSTSVEANESINFAYRPFISKLGRFDTVEGAFQAAKAEFVPLYSSDYKDNLNEVKKLNHAKGENAKLIGENLKGVDIEAWNKVSSTILKELLKQSFEQNQEVTPKTKPVSGAINYPKIFKFFNALGIKNFDKILEKKYPNISLVTIYPSTKDLNDIDSYDYEDGINFKYMMNAITTMQKLNASKDFALFYDPELDKHYSLYDFVKLIAKDVYDINPKILNPNMKDLFDETFTNLAENKDAENAFDRDKNCNG